MAASLSKIKEIPQNRKDLAFGYLRENEKQNQLNYPQLVKYLILLYSNAQDKFDAKCTAELLQISGDTIICINKEHEAKVRHAYLENIVNTGIHIWKFKYNKKHINTQAPDMAAIGIWRTESGPIMLSSRHIDDTLANSTCTGYAVTMGGQKTNPGNPTFFSKESCKSAKHGDIIEMKLDLNQSILTFKLNDEHNTKFENIAIGSYRAVASTYAEGNGFQMVSYQDIYN